MKKYAVDGLDGYPNELAHKLDDALAQNAELLEALKDFYAFKTKGYDQDVEPYNKECPVCHSDKPYHNGLCPKYKVDQAIAKAEGKT